MSRLLVVAVTLVATGCIIDPNDLPPEERPDGGEDPPPQCLAIPVCDDGWFEVDACPADADCRELTLCGVTIACIPDEVFHCEAYPSCDEGDELSETLCEAEEPDCYEREMCGYRVACRTPVPCVGAEPMCAEDEDQSDVQCRPDEECRVLVTNCGGDPVYCRPIELCDAYPTCLDWEYASDEPCHDGEWMCRPEYLCGTWTFCREYEDCLEAGEAPDPDDEQGDSAGARAPCP